MDRDAVFQWVDGYERAWREGDLDAVEQLFTEDAAYRESPYDPSRVGHQAIKAFWLEDEGRSFTMNTLVVAVDGDTAVVRVDVSYLDPVAQDYRDVWILHFAGDGRVADFEEWAYWPDKPYSATAEP